MTDLFPVRTHPIETTPEEWAIIAATRERVRGQYWYRRYYAERTRLQRRNARDKAARQAKVGEAS